MFGTNLAKIKLGSGLDARAKGLQNTVFCMCVSYKNM